jgi:tRNA-dihydrouridine synthase
MSGLKPLCLHDARYAQIAGGFPDAVARTCQLIDENVSVDFVDLNMGCPIDLVRQQGSESHCTH